jgi:uncharacterized protein
MKRRYSRLWRCGFDLRCLRLPLFCSWFAAVSMAQTTAPAGDAGRAVYVGDELLKGYDPKPQLVTKATRVDRPKFPAIDVHCHWDALVAPEFLLRAMDELGVEKAVNLSGGWGSQLERMLSRYHARAPDRLLVFANIDFSMIDVDEVARRWPEQLETYRAAGLSGLKIFKSLGLTERTGAGLVGARKDPSRPLIAIDDPRLDAVFEKCGELKMPVLIHSADPPAFFEPVDEKNERWMQLKRHPDWSFYSQWGDRPSREDVLAQRNRRIARHPRTVFIVAHMAEHADDLAGLAAFLDAHPNAYVDLSAREAEIGRQPFAARRFMIEYADRVLFGTDRYPGRSDQPRHRIYYRMLETDDEYFDYYDHPFPPTGDWKIYGLNLPDDLLRKTYRENALRALKGEMPMTG